MRFLLLKGTTIARSKDGRHFSTFVTTVDAWYEESEVGRTINPYLREIALPAAAHPYKYIRVKADYLKAVSQSRVMAISMEMLDQLKIVDAEELSHLFMLQPNERIIEMYQDYATQCLKVRTEIR